MFKRGLVQFWNALKDNWVPAIGIWVLGALVVYGYYHGGFVRSVSDDAPKMMYVFRRLFFVYLRNFN